MSAPTAESCKYHATSLGGARDKPRLREFGVLDKGRERASVLSAKGPGPYVCLKMSR